MNFIKKYFDLISEVSNTIDHKKINLIIDILKKTRKRNGRLFIIGVGGSAGNASHAVNDFRKLCGIESYAPTDNVSEITARTNDQGFEFIFSEYLKTSNFKEKDTLLIFSVGGGNEEKKVSINLINAIKYGKSQKSKVISIVGKNDGYAFNYSDICVFVNSKNEKLITPISESFQVVIWHLLVSHPDLQINKTKW
jgi:D-sedoheptulose 7-phosphate isomerase